MYKLQLLLCLALAWHYGHAREATGAAASAGGDKALASSGVGVLENVLRGKSRQSRCVRCYEDRYYGSSGSGAAASIDRYGADRYGADRYSGYASRSGDDQRASWYYPSSGYDRYDDRSSSRDRDYYRDDRYTAPRTYDRYEGRGYDNYRGGASSSSSYDRGYGYDNRDRYSADRYSDNSRDRYYDRSRPSYSSYDRYERDPYERYYSRYDFRNYRPWDETYRGQSGFDNSGRGYYFATEDSNRPYAPAPYDRERQSSAPASPCGPQVANCPYASVGGDRDRDRERDRGTKVSSAAIGSDNSRGGGHTSVIGQSSEGKPSGQNSWSYLSEQDKHSQNSNRGGSGDGSSGISGSGSGSGGGNGSGGSRGTERDQQSSSYGGRPRPLGGSYLFDRDSNAVSEGQNEAGINGGGGEGASGMPAAAAQTAPGAEGDSKAKAENAMQ